MGVVKLLDTFRLALRRGVPSGYVSCRSVGIGVDSCSLLMPQSPKVGSDIGSTSVPNRLARAFEMLFSSARSIECIVVLVCWCVISDLSPDFQVYEIGSYRVLLSVSDMHQGTFGPIMRGMGIDPDPHRGPDGTNGTEQPPLQASGVIFVQNGT